MQLLERALGKETKRELLPMQPGDVPATYAEVDDLMRDAGFRPATPIAKGIARFLQGLRVSWPVNETLHYKDAHSLSISETNIGASAADWRSRNPRLRLLEAEAIEIFREAVAESSHPVMLYSIGKDSSAMLHLALKAFAPGTLPFPLLHVDTTWKFREMIAFRNATAASLGLKLIVHINEQGLARGVSPIASGSSVHTQVMKTEALRQALDKHKFDVAFGGARRDEEKSRAKERIFSHRTAAHAWDPRNQRPELWRVFNTRINPGESLRVFPLSNWTELDVWDYIRAENIPVVPLYFAKPRPVLEREGMLIMRDDDRLQLAPGETPRTLSVRFRTLGCYPLTGAVPSVAGTIDAVINELRGTSVSERQGRLIDHDDAGSMEKKKREGYF